MSAIKKTHLHQYLQHPTWATHYYCRVCGFAIVKSPATEKLAVKEVA